MFTQLLQNPIYRLQVRVGRRIRALRRLRIAYACVLFLLSFIAGVSYMSYSNWYAPTLLFAAICWMQLIAALLLPAIFAAPAIAQEREALTLDAILITLLSPQRIITGKYLAVLERMSPIITYAILPLLVAVALGEPTLPQFIVAELIVIAAILLFTAIGVFASSLFKRAVYAIIATIALVAFLNLGIPILPALLAGGYGSFGDSYMAAAMMVVTVAFLGSIIAAFGLFAAIVLVIHSVKPGFQRARVWYIMLYGLLVIGTTGLLHLPIVLNAIEGGGDYGGSYSVANICCAPVALASVMSGFDTETLAYYYLNPGNYYQPSYGGYGSIWEDFLMGPPLEWLPTIGIYLCLTTVVILLARMRFARTQWRL